MSDPTQYPPGTVAVATVRGRVRAFYYEPEYELPWVVATIASRMESPSNYLEADLPGFRVVALPTPAEPTDPAARVIDRDGYVWASHEGTWHHLASGLVRSARTWESLVEVHGPVEVRP